jgi:N-acetylmuramoyl-L-alanine amidase
MKLKANIFSLSALGVFVFILPIISYSDTSNQYVSSRIQTVLDREKDEVRVRNILSIVGLIDEIYADLYNKLKNGGKITIFFDPAHGRLENGKWQGETTGRLSATGLPEEYYSIQFSRKLYKLLSGNKYLRVVSGEDYMKVLQGESSEYKKIFFSETVKFARAEKAFIIVSEHLNNISSLQKSDGLINVPGIHITVDDAGNRYLTFIKSAHKGYLTLYNKYDSSGLSKRIAHKIKEDLSAKGISINSWEYGAVADDRFSYFVDFPASVIFEQGFISNPIEEEKLRDPAYQQKIVESQYNALVDSIKEISGADITGFWLRQSKSSPEMIDLVKLSRIAIYYIQKDMPDMAVKTIDEIEKEYFNSYFDLIEPYKKIKERIIKAEEHFKDCEKALKANQKKKAKTNLLMAGKISAKEPIFDALTERYSQFGHRHFGIRKTDFTETESYPKISVQNKAVKAAINTPVIFAIEKGQSLQDAVEKALSPSHETVSRLLNSFEDAYLQEKVIAEKYSEKKKRTIKYWKWEKEKVDFKEGIYIITINKNFIITRVQKVMQVLLDPGKYQNQQYLKNSYFAEITKEKTL